MDQVNEKPDGTVRKNWALMGLICIGLLGAILGLEGCSSKVYYNQDYRAQVDSAHIDPGRLQFFNDKEFIIRRKTTLNEVKTDHGIVEQTEGLRVQDIRVRRGTPCRVDSVSGNSYWIRFENGIDNHLRFYKNSFDYYQIGAEKWVRGRGKIVYGGRECEIERIGNDCLLMVKNYQRFRNSKIREKALGLHVGTDIVDSSAVDTLIDE